MTIYVYFPIIQLRQGPLHYRPVCPVVVHASVNDELPDQNAPRYA